MVIKFLPCTVCKKLTGCKKFTEFQQSFTSRLEGMGKWEKEKDSNFTLEILKKCDDFERKPSEVKIKLGSCLSCGVLNMRSCPKCQALTKEKFCGQCGAVTEESCQNFKRLNGLLKEHDEIFSGLRSGDVKVVKADLTLVCPHYIKNTPGRDNPQ